MVWQDGRPAVQLRLPLRPAIALLGRDRERLVPLLLVRRREHYGPAVGRLFRSQDLESADSAKVERCAVFAPPPSDFPPPRLRQNSEDAVIPFRLPCLPGIGSQLNKVWFDRPTSQSNELISQQPRAWGGVSHARSAWVRHQGGSNYEFASCFDHGRTDRHRSCDGPGLRTRWSAGRRFRTARR